MLSKALEMGVCFHRASLLGNMEERSFLRAFERRKKNYLEEFYEDFKRYAKFPSKRVSLSIGALLGNLKGVRLPGYFERKEKNIYIWVPFLDPEDIKILSLGAIWNFSNRALLS